MPHADHLISMVSTTVGLVVVQTDTLVKGKYLEEYALDWWILASTMRLERLVNGHRVSVWHKEKNWVFNLKIGCKATIFIGKPLPYMNYVRDTRRKPYMILSAVANQRYRIVSQPGHHSILQILPVQ